MSTATATRTRKKPAPKPKPTVIEIDRPLMPSYSALVAELDIDPAVVCAAYDELRAEIESAFAAIGGVAQVETGQSATAWTHADAVRLRELVAAPEPEPSLLGLLDDLTTEIPMPDFPTEVIR